MPNPFEVEYMRRMLEQTVVVRQGDGEQERIVTGTLVQVAFPEDDSLPVQAFLKDYPYPVLIWRGEATIQQL